MKHLPWIMSALTIFVMWQAGNKSVWAWRVSLVNQFVWLAWIVSTRTWGLLPLNLAMFVTSTRNLLLWSQKENGGPGADPE